ncbi:26S proteasome non-ATPase regulatory subunit 13 [Bombyx mandarina]|uniref:26S proteasome non-ATPase regulatory subunit 13 n=2 Tax=Bombyx TaxID=7090 RepID=Q2F5J1_BOMMO|nr:26S proteasome non-ATPase regulatory subunit 13 [Bombyx mori]XP_028034925.1 26S proteasome non-ATPase regulatory subunit 13 [Bombyx mandarina]ABD36376.1 26S proteasome non-ATPase regulatory subunit 13 [Bombyx mori]
MATVKFAVIDVSDFLTKKQASEPALAADWAKLEELYNKKLWHQLTLKLQEFVKNPALQRGDNLIQLYNNFLTTFESKINPLSLVEIIAHIVEQYVNKRDAVTFLEKVETKVKMNDEALALCKVLQGQIYIEQLNDYDAAEKIIEHLESTLEDADGVTPVHGRFYKLASEYYRVRGPTGRYYRAALRYVGCADGGEALPATERADIAFRLALSGVLAPDVYDLGELLAHPILHSLRGTPNEWACELVKAVSVGDVGAFERIRAKSNCDELHKADRQLRQKIAILCLMEMAFNKSSSQRKLSFEEIAREARIPLDEVELLIMKALAEKLIRGHIDQVRSCATVQWVRPRALAGAGAVLTAARVDAWREAVSAAADLLATVQPDLIIA